MKIILPRSIASLIGTTILFTILASCSTNTSTSTPNVISPTPTNQTTIVSPSGYPPSDNTTKIRADSYPAQNGQNFIATIPVNELPQAPQNAPDPQKGLAAISGVVFSYTTSILVPQTMVYLTQGWGSDKTQSPPAFLGPNKSNGDISATTNNKGELFMDNIPPGNYFLAVSAPYNWSEAITSPKDNKPRLIIVKADNKYVLGIIYISWP
jgi:hypothetical protein